MAASATFKIFGRNPDVLDSIANLSNDEVFTPPWLARQMLDSLEKAWADSNNGANIWEDPTVTFLDPFTKSGVFLREIVARLTKGLEKEIPDLQDRVDHIVTKQVFGIAITQLTSLMARRSVYCSKYANGKHSITKKFDTEDGNIKFAKTQHEWVGGKTFVETADANGNPVSVLVDGKCRFCGTSKELLSRSEGFETHAYLFIHAENIKETIFEYFGEFMHFDVVIGNPPYQLNDGGGSGTSAAPIYQKFVSQAMSLEPRLLAMVIPARWFAGGKGLDDFRSEMLSDERIRVIEDFPDSNDVFPGTQIKGGVCYFLWDRNNRGLCSVTTYNAGKRGSTIVRPLLEPGSDVFIRYSPAVSILKKVSSTEIAKSEAFVSIPEEKRFSSIVSPRRPFGIDAKALSDKDLEISVYMPGGQVRFIPREEVPYGQNLLDEFKVFIPFLASGSDSFPHPILGRPFVGEPGTATTETNLLIGPLKNRDECENVISYISTRFFRFLVLLRKPTQNATRKVYDFVPLQDFSMPWTDEMLYRKYGISPEEIAFIESMIRPMELTDDKD